MPYEKINSSALIGHTGFVGSHIKHSCAFTKYYNSENINQINNQSFDLIVSAGLSGTKYLVNKNPKDDISNIENQKKLFKNIKVKHFVHISTIDVYSKKLNSNEQSSIDINKLDNYAYNRYQFEEFVKSNFDKYHIIRLPMLFGKRLKKNILHDLLNDRFIDNINKASIFQWYPIKNIWSDITKIMEDDIRLINLISEPVPLVDIIDQYFNRREFIYNEKTAIKTDIKTIYNSYSRLDKNYLMSKNEIIDEIGKFVKNYHLDAD